MLSNPKRSKKAVLLRLAIIALCLALLSPDLLRHQPSPEKRQRAASLLLDPEEAEEAKAANEAAPDEFDDADGRNDWFTYQRAYPFAAIPAEARRRAWESLGRMRTQSRITAEAVRRWQPIGPAPTVPAYLANWGYTSGRINAIAVSPADTRIVLAGSATGGIFRSSDGGASFAPVSDDQVDLAVGAFAFAKSRPATVYAGMGDSKIGYLGSGVLKSTNAGQTWARVSNNTLPTPGTIARIDVDPTSPNRVYVAQYSRLDADKIVSSGFYVSNDGGVNWTKTLAGAARDIVIDPANPRLLFGGLARLNEENPPPMRVVRSTDAGATWATSLSGGDFDLKRSQDCRVAISPVNPQKVYAYYGGVLDGRLVTNLLASSDGGATWGNLGTQGFDTGQFGYNTYLAADPNDAKAIYVGSRDVFRSTDSGATWANLTRSFSFNGSFYEYTPGASNTHADQHALTFVPGSASEFYIGNDGGIYKTINQGASFQSLNRTLTLTQFTSLAIHPANAAVSLGGTQDNGTQWRNPANNSWHEVLGGDGGRIVINPLDPNMAFLSYIRGNIYRYYGTGLYFDTQVAFPSTLGENSSPPRIAFYPPLVGNGLDATLYCGTWRLFVCNDSGFTWAAPAGELDLTKGVNDKGSDVLTAIGVARSNTQIVYTGSAQGRAMASTDGGATWRDATGGLPDRSITGIKVDPANPFVAYLTMSGFGAGHVFKTGDGGASWADISGNLPDVPVNTLLIDPLDARMIYIGTDIGVFRAAGGAAWQPLTGGMPPVIVTELASHPSGLIQAATYGRGAFELPAITPPAITSVTWNGKKVMVIEGGVFDSGARLFINDVEQTDYIRAISDATIRIKGKAKALGLLTGDNTIRVTNGDGASTNVYTLTL